MHKKEYEFIAEWLKELKPSQEDKLPNYWSNHRLWQIHVITLANKLEKKVPNFKREVFLSACNF